MRIACMVLCGVLIGGTGCGGAAAKAVRHIAALASDFLLGKGMEELWGGSGTADIEQVKARVAALEAELKQVNPEYAGPVAELRAGLSPGMSWDEYHNRARQTLSRVEAIEARLSTLERRADATDRRVAEIDARLRALERTPAVLPAPGAASPPPLRAPARVPERIEGDPSWHEKRLGELLGRWEVVEGKAKGAVLEFTARGSVLFYKTPDSSDPVVGSFTLRPDLFGGDLILSLTGSKARVLGETQTYGVEFLGDGAWLLKKQSGYDYSDFSQLTGRIRKAPPKRASP